MLTETGETRLPLRIAVHWSDYVFRECRSVAPCPDRDDFPSLALFLHMIKMADGIQILLSAGTSDPTIPLLRSMLEALFSLRFIHLDDYRYRSLCWLWTYIHQEIALKEKVDMDSGSGKELHAVLAERDIVLTNLTPNSSRNKNDIAKLRDDLKHPDFEEIEKEYRRLQQKDRYSRGPKWYRLAGVSKGNYGLAEAVGMLPEYKVYYEWWSASVHGSDATRLLFQQEDGSAEFRSLRSLQHPERMEQGAEVFLQLACQLVARKFLGERELERLFKRFDVKAVEDQ
jgi:hypothetical protein